MVAFIDAYKHLHGVEPICKHLQIVPSTYYAHQMIAAHPEKASARSNRDAFLSEALTRIWHDNHELYGARKMWHMLKREGISVARCTVERLMKQLGLKGAVRGKKVITTCQDKAQPCPQDKVNRQFMADRPNQLWVADFTYVSTWQGMAYVAFVIDVYFTHLWGEVL